MAPEGDAQASVVFDHVPSSVFSNRRYLQWAMKTAFSQPWQQRMYEGFCQTIAVCRVLFYNTAQGSSGNRSHVACKSAFVFLVRDQAGDLTIAHEYEMTDFRLSHILLHEYSFGKVDAIQPPRVSSTDSQTIV